MRREVEPELPPPMIFVPPELSGIPPTPEDALQGWERVVFHEGFVDYETFDRTGEYVITDEYAANLIFEGWFNRDNSLEDQMAYRDDYYMYTGSSSRDFDWQDWKQWYESTAIAA